jgi:hypothetical protein
MYAREHHTLKNHRYINCSLSDYAMVVLRHFGVEEGISSFLLGIYCTIRQTCFVSKEMYKEGALGEGGGRVRCFMGLFRGIPSSNYLHPVLP